MAHSVGRSHHHPEGRQVRRMELETISAAVPLGLVQVVLADSLLLSRDSGGNCFRPTGLSIPAIKIDNKQTRIRAGFIFENELKLYNIRKI